MLLRVCFMTGFLAALFGTRSVTAPFPSLDQLPIQKDLPDPLLTQEGEKITTKEQWEKRRAEWKDLFQYYMYGYLPAKPERISTQVVHEDRDSLCGKAVLQEMEITITPTMPKIYLLLVVPKNRKGPAPVFVGMNFSGNHTLVDDPKIHIPTSWMYPNRPGVVDNKATEAGRGQAKDVWNIEQSIDRGYAVATFYNGDIDPDRADKREGIRPFLTKHADAASDCGTIMAWAWGIHRVVDYLVTDKDIDSKRIICVGHSRLGKTALVATAFDDRIAMAMPLQAGCGGTAPSRGKVGESVKQINDRFPHWFNDRFKIFNSVPEKLPFDQHCLVAICAPRPVLFSNATEDTWANPDGQFEVLKAADPVYRLLNAGGLDAAKPEVGKLIDSKLGYFLRTGKHSMTKEDWKAFLDFADKHSKTESK